MTRNPVERAALSYVRRGWSVIPLRPREKRPVVAWEPHQRASPTEAEVRGWFAEHPAANLGIVTGRASGLVVLDVDPGHGGADSLSRLERIHGPLPVTVEATTGGGGRHLYFAHPGGEVRNRVAILPGVDLRGDGGYVVAPPSLHPSGRRYVWRRSRRPEATTVAPLPGWLLRLITGRPARLGHPLSYWRRLLQEGVKEGERNNTIASLAGHLLWHGVDPAAVTELLLCWNAVRCRPPLPAEEVVRVAESIAGIHARHAEEEAATVRPRGEDPETPRRKP